MKKARCLATGDAVALTNPAGMPPERFRKFIPLMERYLREEGFIVRSYLADESASDVTLASRFMEAWLDPEIRAVFPVCGGNRIFRMIDLLDPKALTADPKIFCGSSALSALSLWLNSQTGLVTFFGPHLPFIHTYAPQRETEFSVQSFWSMVMWKRGRTKRIASVHERHHFFSVNDPVRREFRMTNIYFEPDLITEERKRDARFYTSCTAPVSGITQCIALDALLTLSRDDRASFAPDSIVFTETMDQTIDEVKDGFRKLARAREFRSAKALFLAALTERTDRQECMYPELRDGEKIKGLCDFISDLLGLPVFYGFPLGHGAYKLTMPQGVGCRVNPDDGSVDLLESPVMI